MAASLQRVSLEVAARLGKSSPQAAWPAAFIPASRVRVVRAIAQGTYGEVQLAELLPPEELLPPPASPRAGAAARPPPPKKVAVKRLRTTAIATDEVAALVAEASLLMRVEHP